MYGKIDISDGTVRDSRLSILQPAYDDKYQFLLVTKLAIRLHHVAENSIKDNKQCLPSLAIATTRPNTFNSIQL